MDVFEQRLPGSDDDRINIEPKFVNQPQHHESPSDIRPAEEQQVLAWLLQMRYISYNGFIQE